MIYEHSYQEAHTQVIAALTSMYRSLQRYKAREGANQEWANTQLEWLASFGEYVKAAQNTIEQMNDELSERYKAGYKAGRMAAEKERCSIRSSRVHDQETARSLSIHRAREQWPDLF